MSASVEVDGRIGLERRGPVLVITLDRPRSRNALTAAMAESLDAAMTELDADPALRVGVITGAGGWFCAGQDLAEAVAGRFARTPERGWFGIVSLPAAKPLIAAVEGFALAGGLEIALACDLIVAAETAVFGVPEIHNGQVAAAGGLVRLPSRLPYHVAAQMALTGDPLPADVLHLHGLVTTLAPPGGALDAALALAGRIHSNPPEATRRTLDIVRATQAQAEAGGFAHQNRVLDTTALARTPEYREGVSAFLEKRAPRWG